MASLDPCPHCGRDEFGNAGARAQHVRSCGEKAEKYQEQKTEPQEPSIEPAPNQTQTQQPAVRGSDLGTAGEQLASGMSAALDEDAPLQQRKSGIKQLGELVTGALGGVMEHREKKAAQEEQRARNTNLQPVEDKPQCECGMTFSKIPANANRISCPECGREYKVN